MHKNILVAKDDHQNPNNNCCHFEKVFIGLLNGHSTVITAGLWLEHRAKGKKPADVTVLPKVFYSSSHDSSLWGGVQATFPGLMCPVRIGLVFDFRTTPRRLSRRGKGAVSLPYYSFANVWKILNNKIPLCGMLSY